MKRALLAVLLLMPLAPKAEKQTGIDCPENAKVCTIDKHVFDALILRAVTTPMPCPIRA